MEEILQQATTIQPMLQRLLTSIAALPEADQLQGCCDSIRNLQVRLQCDLTVERTVGRKRYTEQEQRTQLAKVRRSFREEKNKSAVLEAALHDERYAKISGRIQNQWFLRVGIAAPTTATRTLSQWCRDFQIQETQNNR